MPRHDGAGDRPRRGVRRSLGLGRGARPRARPPHPRDPHRRYRPRVPWPERGSHGPADLAACGACHPIRDDGVGHGVRAYPVPATVFTGGSGCAPACHAWLPGDAVVEGYPGADGTRPRYEGSLRPQDLLEAVPTAHTTLWEQGARPDPSQTRITSFNAGCGGCHNVAAEAHGTITTCLDCHRFGGPEGVQHQQHLALIVDRAAQLDPEATAAGASFCAYCHAEDDGPTPRSRRACYACHLSGHQPLDAQGRAHFWPPLD